MFGLRRPFTQLALNTGLSATQEHNLLAVGRLSHVLGLRWSHVDFVLNPCYDSSDVSCRIIPIGCFRGSQHYLEPACPSEVIYRSSKGAFVSNIILRRTTAVRHSDLKT